jgi:hypothetical protein
MNSIRYFWLAVFALFIGIASYMAEEIFFPIRIFPSNTIEYEIHEDFKVLKNQKALPPEFRSIHEVFVVDRRTGQIPINWRELSAADFPQNPTGSFDLQIEIFEMQNQTNNPKENSQMVQYSLFEKTAKNKIWELSREYKTFTKKN